MSMWFANPCKLRRTFESQCRTYASVNRVSIGSDNGLAPNRRLAIILTNAGLSIGPLRTNLSEILNKIQFSIPENVCEMVAILFGEIRVKSSSCIAAFNCLAKSRQLYNCCQWAHLTNPTKHQYPTMHHFVTEMCTFAYFIRNSALWDVRCLTHWGRVTHICVGKLTLVQIMACRLNGAKPLSEPMLEYY